MTARLSVVGTPIGNLDDLAPRARRSLAEADVIACEDTRHTRKLLAHEAIKGRRLIAVHEHNENAAAAEVVEMLRAGLHVALVSDAGMPVLSDPGREVVAAARRGGFDVEVVPGPSAITTAIASSGLRADRFAFEAFLPRKGTDRAARLDAIAHEPRAVVIFEAANRVVATLGDLVEVCGSSRRVAVCRELTKLHEQTVVGPLADMVSLAAANPPRGEVVLVLEADAATTPSPSLRSPRVTGKVCLYVTRPGPEILVFDHIPLPGSDEDISGSGVQLPKGTLHPGEDPGAGALRELVEESGLAEVRVVRELGWAWHYDRDGRDQRVHYFHVEPLTPAPEAWEWDECSDGEVALHRFAFRWVTLEEADRTLHPGFPFTTMFPGLRASLRR